MLEGALKKHNLASKTKTKGKKEKKKEREKKKRKKESSEGAENVYNLPV